MDFTFDNIKDVFDDFIEIKNNVIDISKYKFIEPIGGAILKAIQIEYSNIHINYDESNPSSQYLKILNNREYDPASSYIPIEVVKTESVDSISEKIVNKILPLSHTSFQSLRKEDIKDIKDYLNYIVGEIINNAVNHAMSLVGAVAVGQYFPHIKKLQICVVDRGIGFLENIKRQYNVSTESEAIRKALEKGVSSSPKQFNPYYSTIEHAGMGLYALNKILENTKGRLLIISNDNGIILDYHKNEEQSFNTPKSWKGSIVAFEFFQDNINFSWNEFMKIYIWNDEDNIF